MDDPRDTPANEPFNQPAGDVNSNPEEVCTDAPINSLNASLDAPDSNRTILYASNLNDSGDVPADEKFPASVDPTNSLDAVPELKLIPQFSSASRADVPAPLAAAVAPIDVSPEIVVVPSFAYVGSETPRQRNLRNNLFTLLGLSLASFILTAWVLVRVESPFGLFASGPRDVVSAQLRALDRGEMRASYDLFSDQYRKQVTFDQWRQLVITHWRLFHAEILGAEPPEQSGQRVTLEIHLRGADEKPYRARFTLIRAQGRWWVDDLHWADEPDERDLRRI